MAKKNNFTDWFLGLFSSRPEYTLNPKKKEKKLNMKVQWTKFIIVLVLYLLFLLWLKSWLGLIVVPFIFDVYITKKIQWQWWRKKENPIRAIMSWVDALVFALVAVYFINLFFFQNYVIPSSSLEKSLLTGDYLFVSKASYGPRIPETPLTMPLTQHTMPEILGGSKSYIEWPRWEYRRAKGLGKIQLNDIVVFNYPAGDTICGNYETNYYEFVYRNGRTIYQRIHPHAASIDSLSPAEKLQRYEEYYYLGSSFIKHGPNLIPDLNSDNLESLKLNAPSIGEYVFYQNNPKEQPIDSLKGDELIERYVQYYSLGTEVLKEKFRTLPYPESTLNYIASLLYSPTFGEVDTRPTDRRENYVKRCVGLPGQTLQIKDRIIYLDGKENKEPDNAQFSYHLRLKRHLTDEELLNLKITMEDIRGLNQYGAMPLTRHAAEVLRNSPDMAEDVVLNTDASDTDIYPQNGGYHWTRDNYGPIWIPKKGEAIELTLDNIAIYERPIRAYEHNDLEIRDGKIFINGKETNEYTFKLDYYWMMGDNRHNSADSRYWGFVPEDHIVGKPIFIWWSSDPDRRGFSGIRWGRLFNFVDNIR